MDVNASGQGVQAGSGNVQNNHFYQGDPRFDPASLSDLSSHTAATRIRAMRHDDAVHVLARANVRDIAPVLALLLTADEALTVALLADINRTRAEALIAISAAEVPWLQGLPEAAESIGNRAVELRWSDGGPLERAAPSPQGREGYRRIYPSGQIYARPSRTAFAITGPIAEYFEAQGGTAALGFPTSRESRLTSSLDTEGTSQNFGWVTVFSSDRGAFAVRGKIQKRYADYGGAGHWLGFPVGEEEPVGAAAAPRSVQRFEGGAIFSGDSGAFAARSAVLDCLNSIFPWSHWLLDNDEIEAPVSPYGTSGQIQHFGTPYLGPAVIYSSAQYGVVLVADGVSELHGRLGGSRSWLGFPETARTGQGTFLLQDFEGGAVFMRSDGMQTVAVVSGTMEMLRRDDQHWDRIGYPVSSEEPVGTEDGDRCQFFENGVVTVKDGKREIWLRP